MSYQVLARKYRPQTFAEVVGQEHITTTLVGALAAGRLHHAYLFVGVRGTGKTTVARILARALNCERREGAEPCGACRPCTEIAAGASLDVQEIDGASNTSVEDVRELRERVQYLPSSGRYRISIIDEVHMLSGSAFNALLKTIEEPPPHVVFIFATTEGHKIPATILSRCQRYDFRRIPAKKIAATLSRIAASEGAAVEEEALAIIAREATGSLRDAESLLDQAIAFGGERVTVAAIQGMLGFLDRRRLFELLEALLARDAARSLVLLDEVFLTGADLSRFAADLLELLRHLLVLSECGKERGAVDLIADELELVSALSARSSAPELHRMFSLWYRTTDELARSPFPKMQLEVGLIRLARVGEVRKVDEIVARLDALLDGRPAQGSPLTAAPPPATEVKAASPVPVEARAAPRMPFPEPSPPAPSFSSMPAGPTFVPAVEGPDKEVLQRWQEFLRWVATERPQIASLFHHGVLEGIDGSSVKLLFANPLYADMLSEEERRRQVEGLLAAFFKRPMLLAVGTGGEPLSPGARGERKKELVREALGNEVVRQAADILGARLHDVKVEGK